MVARTGSIAMLLTEAIEMYNKRFYKISVNAIAGIIIDIERNYSIESVK